MKRAGLFLLAIATLAASAAAQNKLSLTVTCGKAEKEYKLEVGDRPGHTFIIAQGTCTDKGDIAGIQVKEHTYTSFTEVTGKATRSRFAFVQLLVNGDKIYGRGEAKGVVGEGEEETWSYTGGTGKFKGIKGKGTAHCKEAVGTGTCEVAGEYELPK